MNKRIGCVLLAAVLFQGAMAQSGTNSPYSQYGFGVLADQTTGFNRGMNGVGVGFREHNQVNPLNPASYSSIDSLTFILDAGVSAQITNFEENGVKKNARNSDFEYVAASFRLMRGVGVSFGLLPFSNVGYNYSATNYLTADKSTYYINNYAGDGGFHQVYFGTGIQLFKGLSVGANIGYLWGSYTRTITNAYSDPYVNSLVKVYSASVKNYKLDAGLQYSFNLGKKDKLTLGATYGFGHKLHANPECKLISVNAQAGVSDTTMFVVDNGLELPATISAGFSVNHNNSLRFGADYSLQKWASIGFPDYTVENGQQQYALNSNYFKDRHKFTVGADICKDESGRRYIDRVHLRAGFSYATPYLIINGQDGPKELSATLGFGIPIINVYNNRSMLNISAQWSQRSAASLIKENTFRINIGITFNEKWFEKWKVR